MEPLHLQSQELCSPISGLSPVNSCMGITPCPRTGQGEEASPLQGDGTGQGKRQERVVFSGGKEAEDGGRDHWLSSGAGPSSQLHVA